MPARHGKENGESATTTSPRGPTRGDCGEVWEWDLETELAYLAAVYAAFLYEEGTSGLQGDKAYSPWAITTTMAAPTPATMPPRQSGFVQADDPTVPTSGAAVPFRDIIPHADHRKIAGIASHDALSWCESRRQIPAPAWLINRLDAKNLETPYVGFTIDGTVREGSISMPRTRARLRKVW